MSKSSFFEVLAMGRPCAYICGFSTNEYADLGKALGELGIDAIHIRDEKSVLDSICRGIADVLLLDSFLAENSRHVLFALPRETMCPVIIFSRRDSERYELGCFEAGVDDYIVWPHSPRVAAARTRSLLKRQGKSIGVERIVIGNLVLFPELFRAYSGGEDLFLSPGDFKLLCHLANNAGKVLTREQIQNEIWNYECSSSPRAVDTQIKRLRRAIEAKDSRVAIQSVYGVGYKLVMSGPFFE